MPPEGTRQLATYPTKTADCRRATRKPVLSALFKRENLLAAGIILMASSLSPFALAEAGVFPDRFFYLTLMPIFLFYVLIKGKIRINPIIAFVLGSQIIAILLALLADGIYIDARLKTIGILLSVGFISVMFRSDLLDIRVFVKVAVLFTIGVLLTTVLSTVFAYLGYFSPVPIFYRGDEIVYQVGYTFTNEVIRTGLGYFIRPGGVFIEPGQLAMHVTLAIIANAVVLGNRKYELLLIFFGLFTISASFYLSLLAFFILFKRWKTFAFFVVGILVVILFVGGLATIREDFIFRSTIGRVIDFFWGEGFGGNRYEATLYVLSNLDRLNVLGSVSQDAFSNLSVEATFWGPFLRYGIVGGMFAYLHIILFAAVPFLVWYKYTPRSRVHTNMLGIFALLSLNLYHRPFTLHFLYYIYLIAMFEWELRRYFGRRARLEGV